MRLRWITRRSTSANNFRKARSSMPAFASGIWSEDYYTAHMLLGISVSRIGQLVRKGQFTDVRVFVRTCILTEEAKTLESIFRVAHKRLIIRRLRIFILLRNTNRSQRSNVYRVQPRFRFCDLFRLCARTASSYSSRSY